MTTDTHLTDTADAAVTPDPTAENGRRALLRKVALGSAGAAVAAMALDRPASAADGDPVNIGEDNDGTVPTTLVITPGAAIGDAAPSAFSVGAATADLGTAPFPAQIGGYGGDDYANGLHGSTTNAAGFGVVAASLADASDDETAPPVGLAVASVNGPQIKFVTLDGALEGPTPGLHAPGELYVDAAGTLWFTVPVAGAPDEVRFVKLAGADTAGSYHALPVAKRVYDSRSGGGAKIAEGDTVDIDLTQDVDGADSGFPAGARTALVNLTITQTEALGYVTLFATGTPIEDVQTSNINWFQPETSIANSTSVAVDAAGSITAFVGSDDTDGVTVRTHVIVDLVGYYL